MSKREHVGVIFAIHCGSGAKSEDSALARLSVSSIFRGVGVPPIHTFAMFQELCQLPPGRACGGGLWEFVFEC